MKQYKSTEKKKPFAVRVIVVLVAVAMVVGAVLSALAGGGGF